VAMPDLYIDAERVCPDEGTGILVRAWVAEHMGRRVIGNHDVASLTRESLIAWLQMSPTHSNPKAESMVLILLGHKPLGL